MVILKRLLQYSISSLKNNNNKKKDELDDKKFAKYFIFREI